MKFRLPLLAAGVVALGAIAAGAATAAASTQSPARQAAAAVTLPPGVTVHGMVYQPSVTLPPTVLLPHNTPKSSDALSGNWAGYVAVANPGVQLTSTGADFNVPSINCAKSPAGSDGTAYVGNWVGLDGWTDGTVEQTGVDAICSTSGTGTYSASYLAWYEMYPLNPVAFSGVSPGDALETTVTYNPTAKTYHMNLTDVTTGTSITATQACPKGQVCDNASAEAITESPGGGEKAGYTLADFGMSNFTATRATSSTGLSSGLNASAQWTSTPIQMVDPSYTVQATPGGLYDGRGFNVTWNSAT